MTSSRTGIGYLAATLVLTAGFIFALSLAAPAQSSADECGPDVTGGAGSLWGFDATNSGWSFAMLPLSVGQTALDDSLNTYSQASIDGEIYEPVDSDDCDFDLGSLTMEFPSDETISGVVVKAWDHLDAKRPAARQLLRLTNTRPGRVTFDFSWQDRFSPDYGDIKLDTTSHGKAKLTKADGWATTCEDVGQAGCAKQGPIRSPELAHVWEGLNGPHDGADAAAFDSLEDVVDLKFKNITLAPGESTYLMRWLVLSNGIKGARKMAAAVAAEPAWAFDGISKKARKKIRNW